MKQPERDDLLSRLDEKTNNIWRTLEELKDQQIKQNGFIQENNNRSLKNTTWLIAFRWIMGGIGTALAIIATHIWGFW